MQDQERDLIEGLFGRLKAYEAQQRDPDAERLIAGLVTGQPGAPYLLTQTVLVQEQALKAAQARIAELEAKVNTAPPPSFLGSAPKVGPWGSAPATPAAVPPGGPWQQQAPQQAPQQPQQMMGGGGGFLRTALTTAAGVAGGAHLADNTSGLPPDSPLMPPDRISSADLAQDGSAADDYDTASNDQGFDDNSSDV
jgi:uncharacterized protein